MALNRQRSFTGRIEKTKEIAPLRPEYEMVGSTLSDLDDGLDSIEFGYSPELSGKMSVNWIKVEIPGLSDPIYQYKSGGGENFSLKFRSDDNDRRVCPAEYGVDITKPEMDLNWLRSKAAARKSNGQLVATPPVLLLVIGNKADTVRIDSISYSFVKKYPSGRPRVLDISLELFYVIQEHRQPDDYLLKF